MGTKGWLIFVAATFVIFSSLAIKLLYSANTELRVKALQLNTILREEKLVLAMSEALQVTFEISPVEADCYSRIYRKWAKSQVVEWSHLAALTQVESRFDPTLTSRAGAQGLMQLMKGTREGLSKKRKIKNDATTPWRDVVNLDEGCEYATTLMKQYGDTVGIALYNVGPGNIDTFKISQQIFQDSVFKYADKIDSVFKYGRRLSLVFEGVKVRSE